jgi:hypothetical protein
MALSLAEKSNVPDAVIQKHIRLITGAREQLDEANGEYRSALKAAKKDGINQKQLIAALLSKKRDQEAVAQDTRDYVRYLGLCMIRLTQADLFGDAPAMPEPRDLDDDLTEHDRWEVSKLGEAAGKAGRGRDENPNPHGTEAYAVWDKAYLDGQTVIAKGLGPKRKIASTRRKRTTNGASASLQ